MKSLSLNNFRRAGLVALVLVGSFSTLSAQNARYRGRNSGNDTRFGLKGGFNLINFRYIQGDLSENTKLEANSAASFQVGAVVEFPVTTGLALQSGLTISKKGANIKQKGEEGKFLYKMRPVYAEIPVNLIIKPQISYRTDFYFGAGPYAAVAVGGKGDYNGPTGLSEYYSDHKLKFGNKSSKDMRGLDAGFNFLAGVEFSRTFSLGAQYGLGVRDLSPRKNKLAPQTIKNRDFSIILTMMVGSRSGFFR